MKDRYTQHNSNIVNSLTQEVFQKPLALRIRINNMYFILSHIHFTHKPATPARLTPTLIV